MGNSTPSQLPPFGKPEEISAGGSVVKSVYRHRNIEYWPYSDQEITELKMLNSGTAFGIGLCFSMLSTLLGVFLDRWVFVDPQAQVNNAASWGVCICIVLLALCGLVVAFICHKRTGAKTQNVKGTSHQVESIVTQSS